MRKSELEDKEKRRLMHNRAMHAILKFLFMGSSIFITWLTCKDLHAIGVSFTMIALSVISDLLAMIFTSDKNNLQFVVSVIIFIYAFAVTTVYIAICMQLIFYDSAAHVIHMGQNQFINYSWSWVESKCYLSMIILMGVYILEHAGILNMPQGLAVVGRAAAKGAQ